MDINYFEEHVKRVDNALKDALIKEGVDIFDEEFLQTHVKRIYTPHNYTSDYYLYHGTKNAVLLLTVSIKDISAIYKGNSIVRSIK